MFQYFHGCGDLIHRHKVQIQSTSQIQYSPLQTHTVHQPHHPHHQPRLNSHAHPRLRRGPTSAAKIHRDIWCRDDTREVPCPTSVARPGTGELDKCGWHALLCCYHLLHLKKYDALMVSLQHIATNNRKQVVEALRVAINAVAPGQATVAALSPPRGRQMKPWVSSGDGDSRHTQAISPAHFMGDTQVSMA